MAKVAIVGTVGVPARYGGFETLAENLAIQNNRSDKPCNLIVYCSSRAYPDRRKDFEGAGLRYIPLAANGKQAIFYDILSIIDAALRGCDVVILLGHGGSFVIPLLKFFTKIKFITNVDGIEWRRRKWSGVARFVIRRSEEIAVRYSDVLVADNEAIREYVASEFNKECEVIPYGGDQALDIEPDGSAVVDLPEHYALALCRIEPENNVAMILEAFTILKNPLVFVGNWDNSQYGRDLKLRYGHLKNIIIHNPIYESRGLRALRERANMYVHGHSAGGTNPALVEMMHFGVPILAHGCSFNRHTTEGKSFYFMNTSELVERIMNMTPENAAKVALDMKEIAQRRYTWKSISRAYFDLL